MKPQYTADVCRSWWISLEYSTRRRLSEGRAAETILSAPERALWRDLQYYYVVYVSGLSGRCANCGRAGNRDHVGYKCVYSAGTFRGVPDDSRA